MTSTAPHIIVLGNEKGGTGKSTVSMHVIVSLLKDGFSVGSMDLDARQGSLTRYIENRKTQALSHNLLCPDHHALYKSEKPHLEEAQHEEQELFLRTLEAMKHHHFIVIDTPGSDSYLSRLAHAYAHTLVTPLNDSFIDLDMIVRLDGPAFNVVRPSTYAEMVWEQKKQKALRKDGSIDWIVMRNRLSSIHAKNKEDMFRILETLSKRMGFRLTAGFSERVIFRSLFVQGLTLLDLEDTQTQILLSHVSARQELRELLQAMRLPEKASHSQDSLSA